MELMSQLVSFLSSGKSDFHVCNYRSTSMLKMTKRQLSFDLVKMAMMLWVVWGHLGLYGIVESEPLTLMHNAKIGVNMPVFFVMSGYFAASAFSKSGWPKVLARSVYYVWPHVTLPILCAVFWLLAGDDSLRTVLGHLPFYWFLRILAIVYLLCAAIYKLAATDKMRWFLFVLVYMVMFFCPQIFHWWWCDQVIHMYPYFVFGLMVLRRHAFFNNAVVSIVCGALYLLAVIFQGDSTSNGMNFWKVCAYWDVVLFNIRDIVTFFARTVVGITGSVFIIFFAELLSRFVPHVNRLAPLGRTSLGIYVLHEYPLSFIGCHLGFLPMPAWSRWIVAIGWFLVCHFAVRLVQCSKVCRFLVFGDEAWIQNILAKWLSCLRRRE